MHDFVEVTFLQDDEVPFAHRRWSVIIADVVVIVVIMCDAVRGTSIKK